MSNLLLITDVARLRNVFSGLADDKTIRLRIANNLEKGGEELALEKPDFVFVQTHLSGLSAEILIMHLKKQLGRKRSRFILLAAPSQVNEKILIQYKGWLDTSSADDVLLTDLRNLLVSLTARPKKKESGVPLETATVNLPELPIAITPPVVEIQKETPVDSSTSQPLFAEAISEPVADTAPEPSLEEQGITYSPRSRIVVHSDFNNSFDNAVDSAPAPEFVTQVDPDIKQDWNAEQLEPSSELSRARSKSSSFLMWLAPVVLAVVVTTYLQQRESPPTADLVVTASTAPALQSRMTSQQLLPEEPLKASAVTDKAASGAPAAAQDAVTGGKSVLPGMAEKPVSKAPESTSVKVASLTSLPDFIPRYGFDKHFSAGNPGWERYKGQVTEFKIYRESKVIKAIQIIDRGGRGIPESFMKGVIRQIVNKPALSVESTEKKDNYEIHRGNLADNLKVVYYRDVNGGKLRAFVISWQ